MIVLLSSNSAKADGAKWEMKCGVEEKIPILGVCIDKNSKPAIPSEMAGKKVIEWTSDGIANFVNGLK